MEKKESLWKEPKKEKFFTKKGIKNFTKQFLENLLYLAEDLGEIAFDRKAAYRKAYGFTDGWSKSKFSKHFNDLKSRGYLVFEDDEKGQHSVKFTNKAKLKILDKIGQRLEVDGKKRFISFDVPEKWKGKRDSFRRALKELGCLQIQKSLWVTNRNIGEYVEMAAYTFGIEQYVVYIIAEQTDIDGIIENKLKQGTDGKGKK